MSITNEVKETLQSHGLRVTQSRLAVATILHESAGSLLTSEEIYSKIQNKKGTSCDQASVYRSLSTFEEIGLVEKNNFQGEASRYELKAKDSLNEHKHYFKCYQCQTIEPFHGCALVKKEKELERKGYRNLKHHLEITGLCPSCAPAAIK